jgi:hypothetical protein
MNIYERHGYSNRTEYLSSIADDCENPEAVFALADVLGEGEDFDGLISMLEDFGLY